MQKPLIFTARPAHHVSNTSPKKREHMLSASYLLYILGINARTIPFLAAMILVSLINFWQLFWIAVIPFILIKTVAMQKFFKQETFKKLLLINTVSNGLSTFIGVPIAIGILFNISFIRRYWPPIFWIIFGLLLFPYAYYVSVWIERWVVTKFLGKTYERETISQAVKSANKMSYRLLFAAYVLYALLLSAYVIYNA
jgi:hypothetical protein